MIDVRDELEYHCKKVREKFPDCPIVYAGIYGSQNYGLATPESDVDSYVVIYPSWRMLATGNTHISQEVHLPQDNVLTIHFGEHIVIKDVFTFYTELLTGSSMAIEVVSSPYFKTFHQGKEDELFYHDWTYYMRETLWYRTKAMRQSEKYLHIEEHWDEGKLSERNFMRRYIVQLNVLHNLFNYQNDKDYPSNMFFIEEDALHDAAADVRTYTESFDSFRKTYQLKKYEDEVFTSIQKKLNFTVSSKVIFGLQNSLDREKIKLFQEYILKDLY